MAQADNTGTASPELVWEIAVPLLNNRIMFGGVTKAFGIAGLIMGSLLSFLFLVQDEAEAIPSIWLLTGAICGGMWLLSVLVMLVVFRNHMHFRFSLSDDRVLVEQIDTTAKAANRIAAVAGALAGSPSAAGAGILAQTQETQSASFDGSFRAVFRPRGRVILLRNRWRTLLAVYCTAENYDTVAARISAAIAAHGTDTRVPEKSPIPRYLGYTALAILACVPSFLAVEAFDVSLLIPLIMLCFALTTIWLMGVFGWVVLGMAVVEIGAIVMNALSVRESFFSAGETYVRYEVFSGDDWALIALVLAGLAVLAWISVRGVTGRLHSVLESDYADMGEGLEEESATGPSTSAE